MVDNGIERKFVGLGNAVWSQWGSESGFHQVSYRNWGTEDPKTGTVHLVFSCLLREFIGDGYYRSYNATRYVFILDGCRLRFALSVGGLAAFGGRRGPGLIWQDTGDITTVQDILHLCHMLTIGSAMIFDTETNQMLSSLEWYNNTFYGGKASGVKHVIWQVFNGNTYAEERFLEEHIYERVFHPKEGEVHSDWIPRNPANPIFEPGYRWFGSAPLCPEGGCYESSVLLYGHCLNCGRFTGGPVEGILTSGCVKYNDDVEQFGYVCSECQGKCDSCGAVTNPNSLFKFAAFAWGEESCDHWRVDELASPTGVKANENVCFNCGSVFCHACAGGLTWEFADGSGVVTSINDKDGLVVAKCPMCGSNSVYEHNVAAWAPYFVKSRGWYDRLSKLCPKMYSGRLAPMDAKSFVGFWNSLSDAERVALIDDLYASSRRHVSNDGTVTVDAGICGRDAKRVLKLFLPVRGAYLLQ